MFPHSPTNLRIFLAGDDLGYTVYQARSTVSKTVGVMGRSGLPRDTALVFPFDRARPRGVHMLGVFSPIRVWWLCDGAIQRSELLTPMTGFGVDHADVLVELPDGAPRGSTGQPVEIV